MRATSPKNEPKLFSTEKVFNNLPEFMLEDISAEQLEQVT